MTRTGIGWVRLAPACLLLMACQGTQQAESYLGGAADALMNANRIGFSAARWEVCDGVRMGVWRSELTTVEQIEGWAAFCSEGARATPPHPND